MFAALLVACDDKDDSSTSDSGTTTELVPTEGQWQVGSQTLIDDGCGLHDEDTKGDDSDKDKDKDNTATLTLVDSDTFTIIPNEGPTLTCALEPDGSFVCDPFSKSNDFTENGIDAILTMTLTISGAFESSYSGSITLEEAMSCEGADCAMVEAQGGTTLPCTSLSESTISLIE